MDPRAFLESYQVTDIEKDPLPIKVLRNAITKEEIVGQAGHWAFDYLDQRFCPLPLISRVVAKLVREVREADFSHCSESTDDSVDSGNDAAVRYEPLKLMRAIVKIIDEVCIKEREDYQDSVDGMVESPDMQPHVFAVSYGNIKNTRRFMEDRMTILPRMDRTFNLERALSYFAVFDGHNGSEAAAYSAAQLHQCLIQSMSQCPDVISSISDAFERLDDAFIQKCASGKVKSGSTVVMALIMPDRLYVAWVGDSQAVLAKSTDINNLVTSHKPERPDEIDRIRSQGGEVFQMNGTYRVNGNLAVSRAIGDADDKAFIISTPDIKMLELDGSEEFLILACDGLWDEISPEAAAQIVRHQVVNGANNVSAISQKLIQQAKHYGSTDNITVIVVFLEPLELIRNRYETVMGAEIDLSVFRKVNEPTEHIPIEKQLENSNMGLGMELNGHVKDADQLVDFLSFGSSSRESGAQLIGDEGNQFGDDVIIKREVEEDLSDASSDEEWKFEKPPAPDDTSAINNGLSENPFATTAASEDRSETIDLLGNQLQEASAEPFNPFSTEPETIFQGKASTKDILVEKESDSQKLISNQTAIDAAAIVPIIDDNLNSTTNMNPFHFETAKHEVNLELQEEPGESVFVHPDISNDNFNLAPENISSSNPFDIGSDQLNMFEATLTEPSPVENQNAEAKQTLDQIKMFGTFDEQVTIENQSNAPMSPMEDDKYLAQVESNPIPEDVVEEIERNNANLYGTNNIIGPIESEANPFSAELQNQHNDHIDNFVAMTPETVTASDNIKDGSLEKAAHAVNHHMEKIEEPEKYEQELLVDDFSAKTSGFVNSQDLICESLKLTDLNQPVEPEVVVEDLAPTSVDLVPSLDMLGSSDIIGKDGGIGESELQQDSRLMPDFNLNTDMMVGDQMNSNESVPLAEDSRASELFNENIEKQSADNLPRQDLLDAFDTSSDLKCPVASDIADKIELVQVSPSANGHLSPSDLQTPTKESAPNNCEQGILYTPQFPATVEVKDKASGTPKPKVEPKLASKTPKSPCRVEIPTPKARTPVTTTAPIKKSLAKSITNGESPNKTSGTAQKTSPLMKAPISKPLNGKPAPPKATGAAATPGVGSRPPTRPLSTASRPAPPRVLKDADTKVASKATITPTPRVRPTTAPITSATKPASAPGTKPTTSPKRIVSSVGASARLPSTRPSMTGLPAKTEVTGKTTATAAAVPKPRARPSTTLSSRTTTSVDNKTGLESKKLIPPKPAAPTSTSKPATRPPISRPLPSSSRTAVPAKSATTNLSGAKTTAPRPPLKSGDKPGSAPARTAAIPRVPPPTRTTSTVPKKVDTSMKAKKPAGASGTTQPTPVPKKPIENKSEKNLIEQNGLAPVEASEIVKELNGLIGMNGEQNAETDENEKQDAVKENGVYVAGEIIEVSSVDLLG